MVPKESLDKAPLQRQCLYNVRPRYKVQLLYIQKQICICYHVVGQLSTLQNQTQNSGFQCTVQFKKMQLFQLNNIVLITITLNLLGLVYNLVATKTSPHQPEDWFRINLHLVTKLLTEIPPPMCQLYDQNVTAKSIYAFFKLCFIWFRLFFKQELNLLNHQAPNIQVYNHTNCGNQIYKFLLKYQNEKIYNIKTIQNNLASYSFSL
eukprot:TRINITY_DN3090_c0_g1_i1.p2 TRINITY_DN3090_c0_g1~~TRINITY_DN3090_c0_g1_i1.p2  ORF type:complete len:206 (-),score=-18.54 TRINITY_DN3090_c0_g1_i1:74-691(-)